LKEPIVRNRVTKL